MFKSYGPNWFAFTGGYVLITFAALVILPGPTGHYIQTLTQGTGVMGLLFTQLAAGLATALSVGLVGIVKERVFKKADQPTPSEESPAVQM